MVVNILRIGLTIAALALVPQITGAANDIVWPTQSKAFDAGEPAESFIQGTLGKPYTSGLFGDVRNSGYKFHEGIDIKATTRSRKNEPLDEIYAAMSGVVKMVNKVAGNSSYGRYVVVEHPDFDVAVYTLYAHLSEIDDNVKVGKRVSAGEKLGIMGRSANYSISRECAHLHYEVGLRYGSDFESWYKSKKYKEKNRFGNFNGMNMQGFDPLEFMRLARQGAFKAGFADYIKNMLTAVVVRIYTKKTPDFAKLYPNLVDNNGQDCGWDVYFTWFGMPHKIERIKHPRADAKDGTIEIVKYNPDELSRKCRKMFKKDKKGRIVRTDFLKETMDKMF